MSDLQFAWHVHHNILMEPLTESIETRRVYIETNKAPDEQVLRLRLLKPVQGEIPVAIREAGNTYSDAYHAYNSAHLIRGIAGSYYAATHRVYADAARGYKIVLAANMPTIEALHEKECPDCPWNGETIFPEKEKE